MTKQLTDKETEELRANLFILQRFIKDLLKLKEINEQKHLNIINYTFIIDVENTASNTHETHTLYAAQNKLNLLQSMTNSKDLITKDTSSFTNNSSKPSIH